MSKNQTFVAKAHKVHGDKYDYSKVDYKTAKMKVEIVCREHGSFFVIPNAHLSQKTGCPKCSGKYKPTTQEFIDMCRDVHGNAYDYSKVEYKNNHTKIEIVCPIHGSFKQKPVDHLRGKSGCPKCGNVRKGLYHKKTTQIFIEEASKVHGLKYVYDKVQYTNIHDKVTITCPKHGDFEQTPASHINGGNGCPRCSVEEYQGGYGFKRFENNPQIKDNPAMLYLIRINDEFIKIGITQNNLKERFKSSRLPYQYETINIWTGKLYDLFVIEQSIKKQFKHYKYTPSVKFDGHTECFILEAQSDIEVALSSINGAYNG